MIRIGVTFVLAAMAVAPAAAADAPVLIGSLPAGAKPLPLAVTGRVERAGKKLRRQWPGTYFETAFIGASVLFQIGEGDVHLRITVDRATPIGMVKPAAGIYRLDGLSAGIHRLRIDMVSEGQTAPTEFNGFFAPAGVAPAALPRRARQIEFIGDSHTVGYGNTSTTRTCTEDQIWASTDTAQGIAPRVANRYGADYRVNAISGRGVVRNYNGFGGDLLPQAYPYLLFDKAKMDDATGWHPQVIVLSLGTNDFSTPLNPGEKWATRPVLREDYEASFVRFVQGLRKRNPQARFVLWASDIGDGEVRSEVSRVVDRLKAGGETRVGFVPVAGVAFTACNYHPSLEDDQRIADAVTTELDAHFDTWGSAKSTTINNGEERNMTRRPIAAAAAVLLTTTAATAQTAPAPAATAPASGTAMPTDKLADKLITAAGSSWSVFGNGQTNQVVDGAGPKGYAVTRTTVAKKGANPWDIGAATPIQKPIAAGDTVLVAVYLRAPMLKDGETLAISYLGLNQAVAPYDIVATTSPAVTNQWKMFYASGRAKKAYTASELAVGAHLASNAGVVDLGPVRAFDFGPNVDPASLPKSQ